MDILSSLLSSLQFIGPIQILRSLRYSNRRDNLERDFVRHIDGKADSPGLVQSFEAVDNEGLFRFADHLLKIRFLAVDLARITWEPGLMPLPYTIAQQTWGDVAVQTNETKEGWDLKTEKLHLQVKHNGDIHFYTPQGEFLTRFFVPTFQGDGWQQRTSLEKEECIYGLGERAARLNRRGKTYRIWNSDPEGKYGVENDPLYTCIPVYSGQHTNGSYLVFHENSHDSTLSIGDETKMSCTGGALRYYFIAGSIKQTLQRYTELTGRPPIPPRWALGYHQSRWGYKSEQDVRRVAQGFEDHNLPLSAIHLDIDYMRGYRLFTIHPDRFPNMPTLVKDMKKQDIQLVPIVDVGIKIDSQYSVYNEGKQEDVFCKLPDGSQMQAPVWPGWCVFPDFTKPAARSWWGNQYKAFVEAGFSGFWHDMNEPAAFAGWGEFSVPHITRHDFDGRGGSHQEAHNLYAFLENKATFETLRQLSPQKRPWIVSRSGWAGSGHYSWIWTGDVNGTWEMLRRTVAILLGLSLSGVFYVGSDTGGFSAHPDAELYTRWFQMSAFTPFFRTHCATNLPPREPWTYGKPTLEILRDYLNLRYQLMPYLYTLAWQASQEGKPLIRPLFWEDPQDTSLWENEDAFLLGDSLLVAPILDIGKSERDVHLPKGNWFDFWDDHLYTGSQKVVVSAPIERIPLFVKAGTVLPLEKGGKLELHVYSLPGQNEYAYALYSDAGDGYGEERLDHFVIRRNQDGIYSWNQESEGEFPFPYKEIELIIHA